MELRATTEAHVECELHQRAMLVARQLRGMARFAFGKPIMSLGGNRERLADCRMAIDQARLLTLFAAHQIDVHGVQSALTAVSAIKVVAPNMLQMVIAAS